MSKIKIMINNPQEWVQAIDKVKEFGAISRDGSTIFLPEKPDMVIDTTLSAGNACILSSRTGYMPKKNPYTNIMSFKDLMASSIAPWNDHVDAVASSATPQVVTEIVEVPVYVSVETQVGVCAQTTLRISAVEIVDQQPIIFKTVGIPWLVDNGLDITEDGDKMYIVDAAKNTAIEFTAKTAANNATKALLDNETNDLWARYAIAHDLIVSITHSKEVEEED